MNEYENFATAWCEFVGYWRTVNSFNGCAARFQRYSVKFNFQVFWNIFVLLAKDTSKKFSTAKTRAINWRKYCFTVLRKALEYFHTLLRKSPFRNFKVGLSCLIPNSKLLNRVIYVSEASKFLVLNKRIMWFVWLRITRSVYYGLMVINNVILILRTYRCISRCKGRLSRSFLCTGECVILISSFTEFRCYKAFQSSDVFLFYIIFLPRKGLL